ncbi:MAG: hypothetical protein Fur0018_14320 [Anaerolineales bacterium]
MIFPFSQTSLQDFADCRRRFQLRYLMHIAWPAPQAEPLLENERHIQQGAAFHRLLQQRFSGLPIERLETMSMPAPIDRWWNAHRHTFDALLGTSNAAPPAMHPETVLMHTLGKQILLARYDLLVVWPADRILILDWKTSRRPPRRTTMAQRIQTRLYPFLMALAGAHLNAGTPWRPEQIEMVYWFAEAPAEPMRFPYSTEAMHADQAFFTTLLAEAAALPPDDFPPPAADERACRYCVYRSLCDRGIQAGDFWLQDDPESPPDDAPAWQMDFDAIEPVAF